jgi:hypothetical protein
MICMIHIRPEKTECSYFPGYVFCTSWLYVFVLPDAILRTYMVFFWLHHHNIVLPSVIMLYFLSLSHSTSRCHNIVFSFVVMLYFFLSWLMFYAKIMWDRILLRMSVRTFCSCCYVLPVITMLYFLLWKLFFTYLWGNVCIS